MIKENSLFLTDEETAELKKLFSSSESLCGYSHGINGKAAEINTEELTMAFAEHMYQLSPKPEKLDDYNDYIVKAKRENNMKYFWFFLHWFEPVMNKAITNELTRRDKYDYNPNRFMIIKSDYLMFLLKSFIKYDETKGVKFTTFIYSGKSNPVVCALGNEEPWSYDSLAHYKTLRSAGYLLNNSDNLSDAVSELSESLNCSVDTAKRIIISSSARKRILYMDEVIKDDEEDFEETFGNTVEDTSSYFRPGYYEDIPAREIRNALSSLTEKEQFILRKFYAICPYCKKVMPMEKAKTLRDISETLEGSSRSESSIEKAKTKALDKMAVYLWNEGLVKLVEINRLNRKKSKGITVYAEYSYRPYGSEDDDCDGIIAFDFANKTFEIIQPADRDDARTNAHGRAAAKHILSVPESNLPKKKLVAFVK